MVKCIHTGDLHLGTEFKSIRFTNEYANKRRIELWETFDRIIDRAINIETDFLLISGDLFEEKYFSIGDIKRVRDKFSKLRNINVLISTGNHDPFNDGSLYKVVDWSDNVYIFPTTKITKKEFKEKNTVIWGYSWNKKEEKVDLFSEMEDLDMEKINILLIHGDVLNKESKYLPLNKKVLLSMGFDYIALGHIHKPQFIENRICYCGSPEPLNFGETGVHGIIEGTIEKNNVSMSMFPFSKRSFMHKEINVTDERTFDGIIQKILKCDNDIVKKQNLYRIILTGIRDRDILIDTKEMEQMLSDSFSYIEVEDKTIPDFDLDKLEKDNKNNIIGLFINEMKKKDLNDDIMKSALYLGLDILLREKVNR